MADLLTVRGWRVRRRVPVGGGTLVLGGWTSAYPTRAAATSTRDRLFPGEPILPAFDNLPDPAPVRRVDEGADRGTYLGAYGARSHAAEPYSGTGRTLTTY